LEVAFGTAKAVPFQSVSSLPSDFPAFSAFKRFPGMTAGITNSLLLHANKYPPAVNVPDATPANHHHSVILLVNLIES
jgi:hypothetical protein